MKRLFIWTIKAYQCCVSPLLGRCCRFYPSCSAYMIEAIETHGVFKGVGLGALRLLKCHPFHPGGFDPVPPSGRCAGKHDHQHDHKIGLKA